MFVLNPPFCKPCGKTFHSNQQLIIHNSQFHPISQPLLPSYKNSISIRTDLLETSNDRIQPTSQPVSSPNIPADVMETSNSQLNFICEWCKKAFSRKKQLQIHAQIEHGQSLDSIEDIKLTCQHCFKAFNHLGHLKEHVDNVHLGVKFTCDICQKQFARERVLRAHKKTAHPELFKILILNPRSISENEFQSNGLC